MDLARSFWRFLPKNLPTPNHSMSLQLEGFKVRLDGGWSDSIYWKMSLVMIWGGLDLERSLPIPNYSMSLRLGGFKVGLGGAWSNPIYWKMTLVI